MRYLTSAVIALLLGASAGDAGEKVSQFIGLARVEAERWQRDAVLVEIHVTAGADGTLDPRATPQQAALFHFISPSTNQGLVVSAVAGKIYARPGRAAQSRVPIPDTFLDLSDAVARAGKTGLRGGQISATLRAEETGGNRIRWSIIATDLAGASQTSATVDAGPAGSATAVKLPGEAERRDDGFSFYDLRVQGSPNAGSHDLSRVKEREKFWIVFYLQNRKPAKFEFSMTFINENGVLGTEVEYRELSSGSVSIPFWHTITTPKNIREYRWTIEASVTVSGVTQTRTKSFSVYR